MILNNKVYDTLRVIQDILPIVGTLVATLLALYKCPEEIIAIVSGTFTAVSGAVVSFLRVCKSRYDVSTEIVEG